MIIDCNASCGHWPSRVNDATELPDVWRLLHGAGIEKALMASLDSAWCANPHAPNHALLTAAAGLPQVLPVPTIDPTVHTWREHLAFVARSADVRMIRLLPTYAPYELDRPEVDELLDEVRQLGIAVQVQTRIEDPRRHHPLARVPDLPAAEVLALARRHPSQTIVIGGARFTELQALAKDMLELNLVYADTSQCDGLDAVRVLSDLGLAPRLLYGSHAPLFGVSGSLLRVLHDLPERTTELILSGNARRALGLH